MKKTIFTFFGLFVFSLVWGQATLNQSLGAPQSLISNPIAQQFSGQEIFRFRSGLVTQLDAGNNFGFTNSQWFALGRVGGTANGFNQNFYGLRFQQPNRALVMGYTSTSPDNPLIQWVGNGSSTGNLEFKVGLGFGSAGVPGPDLTVATMTREGNTWFGKNSFPNSTKVGIDNDKEFGLQIKSSVGSPSSSAGVYIQQTNSSSANYGIIIESRNGNDENYGIQSKVEKGEDAIGILSVTKNGLSSNISLLSLVQTPQTNVFNVGVYGGCSSQTGGFAGYFDGNVFTTGSYLPSDANLKTNIQNETDVLNKINQLRPVTYDYKKMSEINLSQSKQHGFISQELAEVFPELTLDITKPVFDENGKIVDKMALKTINYNGLISILTTGIQELHEEVKVLKEELASFKANDESRKRLLENNDSKTGYFMEQNVPNPFGNQTSIRYQLPSGVNQATISIFDLNGKFIKDYPIRSNSGELVIKANDIGKGLFLYCLNQNGQEMMTKKMMIK